MNVDNVESDRGPCRIPDNAVVEDGTDGQALVMDRGN